ncbi:response regulator transcription factor [Paenibacillus sp. TAB 01]|uniref:response regulator transcription factor n=1 Tax=Paenibacillus sp. TAB 01 TaxID=3368988 RepID=UPI003751106A
MRLLVRGASNKEIAQELSLSLGTVKVYLSRIYAKLGVTSRTQALIAVQELGLLEL